MNSEASHNYLDKRSIETINENAQLLRHVKWSANDVASSQPVTDDPLGYYDKTTINDSEEIEDDHSRFLMGDWPR